jgi:hypothetical protein
MSKGLSIGPFHWLEKIQMHLSCRRAQGSVSGAKNPFESTEIRVICEKKSRKTNLDCGKRWDLGTNGSDAQEKYSGMDPPVQGHPCPTGHSSKV